MLVDVDGLSVGYERAGTGPPLVLLHGFSHDARVWRPQLDALSDQFTTIAWDAPGAGRSSDPRDAFGIADWADSLAGFLNAVAVKEAHLVGLSWGGILAQEYYRRHPGRVLSLVLADTYAGWKGSLAAATVRERLAGCLRDAALAPPEFVSRYLPGMLGESATEAVRAELAEIMSQFHPNGFRLMAESSAVSDTRDLLPEIGVPTLLVWGDSDKRSPITIAHQFLDAIPGARLVVIPGAGHVSNLEEPGRFNAEIRGFCLPGRRD
jgi:pimeloyl-ACP methyl ester carboxylesterase